MSALVPSVRIARLKTQARSAYLAYHRETADMTCGHTLAQHMNPRAAKAAREHDDAMEILVRIDPAFPGKTFVRLAVKS